jgi:hypothetical protein
MQRKADIGLLAKPSYLKACGNINDTIMIQGLFFYGSREACDRQGAYR